MTRGATLWLVGSAACFPNLDDAPFLVRTPRILAVRAEPAEIRPGQTARYTALLATATGSVADHRVEYAFCLQPRVLEERNGVAPECLDPTGGQFIRLSGRSGVVPIDICARFGSVPPPSEPEQPPFRPVDPDGTGGYYLPVRVTPGTGASRGGEAERFEDTAFGFQRIRCDLQGAPFDVAREFARTYADNQNPAIEALQVGGSSSGPVRVARGETVDVRVVWSAASAEPYRFFDPVAVQIRDRVEAMAVSWFATGGSYTRSRSRVEEARSPAQRSVDNRWTAPDAGGDVWMGVVVRDARGGVDWRSTWVSVDG